MTSKARFVHVAAGCLLNASGEVLVCQRPAGKIYPGEWEFPGGKVEPGEGAFDALARELREELGIRLRVATPLIRLRHVYPELAVQLDVWRVSRFEGTVHSTEHPAIAWVAPDALLRWPLLAADRPIVSALRLPARYVFTPPEAGLDEVRSGLATIARPAMLRLRLPRLSPRRYQAIAEQLVPACAASGISMILDREPEMVEAVGAHGWHATAAAAAALRARPVPSGIWFGASCHDAAQLSRAQETGADFAVLGPVQPTPSHPGRPALGWDAFAGLALPAGIPVFAIGGLSAVDERTAREHGGVGVAGISGFWAMSALTGSEAR